MIKINVFKIIGFLWMVGISYLLFCLYNDVQLLGKVALLHQRAIEHLIHLGGAH